MIRVSGWFWLSAVLLPIGSPKSVRAQVPTLEHFYPVGALIGSTQMVQMIGSPGVWPPQVWVDSPGLTFRPQTNSGFFSVELSPSASPGPHLVRIHNAEGASATRFFIAATEAQTAEIEPNDEFRKPQIIPALPALVNGRLDKSGDVDSFAFELKDGQTLVASLEAYVLASPVDAVLRVLDPGNSQVALNHDDGVTFDPRVTWTAKTAGRYVVQVFGFAYPAGSDIRFSGGNSSVYRLHLSGGPVVSHTLPLGIVLGQAEPHTLVGWNLPISPMLSTLGAPIGVADGRGMSLYRVAGVPSPFRALLGIGTELLESESKTGTNAPLSLPVPGAITARIDRPGDEDRFRFRAEKGDRFWIEVKSASLGFALDAWLKVENAAGNELVRNDDSNGADPALEWVAPDTGEFLAVVGNLLHQGSESALYRLSIEKPLPKASASVAATSFVVKGGETNAVKVSIKRQYGHVAKLKVSLEAPPDGLIAPAVDVEGKQSEATLSWSTKPDVKPFSGPVRIRLADAEGRFLSQAIFSMVTAGTDNGVPNGFGRLLIESTSQLWLNLTATNPPSGGVKK